MIRPGRRTNGAGVAAVVDRDYLVDVELITEPAEVVRCSLVRDAAWHHAVPHELFAAEVHQLD
nr:DUF6879 family protein [Streptomyces sp. Ncost-T10-10d]